MKTISDIGAIREYFEYLAKLSNELICAEMVYQDDIDRLSIEVDHFIEQLKNTERPSSLITSIEASRRSTLLTTPKDPRTFLSYTLSYSFWGWPGHLLSRYKEERKSQRRKNNLSQFKRDMLNLAYQQENE